MKKKTGFYVVLAIIGLIAVAGVCFAAFQIGILVERNIPSKTVMSLQTYFKEPSGQEVVVILQDSQQEKRGLLKDGRVYLDYETVCREFAKRFYIDEYENLLLFTTPTKLHRVEIDSTAYSVNGAESSLDYVPALWEGEELYIALDYVKNYAVLEYQLFQEPNRAVVSYKSGNYQYASVKKDANLRIGADIKADIVSRLEKGAEVHVLEREDKAEFARVMTEDGIIGFVSVVRLEENRDIAETYEMDQEEYTSIQKEEPIKLAWHQVFNQTANTYLPEKLEQTQGINVISPTWFSVESDEGRLSTLADEEYVKRAHARGIEVWPLIDDFNKNVDFNKVFGRTTNRTKLVKNIMYFIREFNLDGINIDFERITEKNAPHYIQFLRELSISCREQGVVLSIDNYVPFPHTAHYDREEQGILADYIMVMAYDEHYSGSPEAGSVSTLNWVKMGCERTMEEVPAEKIIVGLPLYTRLWKESSEDGKTKLTSEACGMLTAERLLEENGVTPVWLEEEGQYYGEYEKKGIKYRIWLEEERSIASKLDMAASYNPAGIGLWKLGLEKPEVWNEINRFDIK